MKPLTWLVMILLSSPSVGASPSGEEFVIEVTAQITEIKVVEPSTNLSLIHI